VGRHLAAGGGIEFVTLTLPHDEGDSLRGLFTGVTEAWQFVNRDWAVRQLRRAGLVVGSVRAVEVTYGASGWHPHLHVLMVTSRPLTADERSVLRDAVFRAWVVGVQRRGWRPPSQAHGVTVEPVTSTGVGDYMAKMGAERVANYLVQLIGKGGDGKGRSPWQILAGAGELVAADVVLWREYESATRGRRMLTWTKALKERLGVGEDDPEDELAEGEVEPEEHCVATLTGAQWSLMVAHPSGIERVLRAAEEDGGDGVEHCLEELQRERVEFGAAWWPLREVEERPVDLARDQAGLFDATF
jgi:hypothetical protein